VGPGAARLSRRGLAAAAAALGALVVAVNLPLLTGAAHPIWDADAAYAPWHMLVSDAARALRLLVWDPWSNGGSPDGFDPQFGARSPLHLLVGLVFGGSLGSFYVLWLTTWWLSGVGTLLLSRWLGFGAVGAGIAALAFSFSGFQLGHAQHTSFVFAYAAMPFVVWRLDVALCTRRLRPTAESAALFGMASLGGYPGVSVVSAMFLGLWALGRVALARGSAPEATPDALPRVVATPGWLAGAAALWGVVAIVVAAPTTLGLAYEAHGFSDRSEAVSFERAVETNAMLPAALFSAFGPGVANLKRADRDAWPGSDVSSMTFYLGAVTLWLAACALALARRRAFPAWLWAMGLLGLGFALGTTLPLRGWLYDLVPPTRFFRHASIFRAWFELAVAIAAGIGWRELEGARRGPVDGARRFVPLALALALAGAATTQLGLVGRVSSPPPELRALLVHGALAWAGVVALAAAVSLRVRRGAALGAAAIALAALDLGATAWLQRGLRMDRREAAAESWRAVEAGRRHGFDLVALDTPRVFTSDLFPANTNKNLPQRIPTLRNYTPLLNRFQRSSVADLNEIGWAIGADRMWFVPRRAAGFVALSDANRELAAARFRSTRRRFIPLHVPDDVLDPLPPGEDGPRAARDRATLLRMGPASRLPHRVLVYEPERLVIEVDAPDAGYAVVTDRWARGWTARVDGEPTPLLGAGFVFRAVAVPPGTHEIEMVYAPRSHPALLVASWGTLATVLAWTVAAARRAR